MKPNFALTLSLDGIRLLHRSAAGWTVVGQVSLEERDLAGAMAAMRATAVGLEPAGLRSVVMLPPDQVRVMEAPGPGEAAARAVLAGATPYAVDDLVLDHASDGGRHLVAAVARETLEEAEAFAAEHRVHPVSFAADLAPGAFPRQAFFGETRLARAGAERVEPDGERVEPSLRRPAEPEDDAQGPEPAGGRPAAEASAGEGGPAPSVPVIGAPEPTPAVEPLPITATGEEEATPPEGTEPEVAAAAALASAEPTEAPLSEVGIPEPVFASRSRVDAPVMVGATRVPLRAPSRLPGVALPSEAKAAPARAAAPPQPGQALRAPPPAPGPGAKVAASPAVAAAATASAAASKVLDRRPTGPLRPASPRPSGPVPLRRGGRPPMALALAAAAVLVMVVLGVWAGTTGQSLAGLLQRGVEESVAERAEPTVEPALEPAAEPSAPAPTEEARAAAPVAPTAEQAGAAAAAVAAALDALPAPEPAADAGTVVSPAEAERVYAATGVWLRAPRLADLPRPEAAAPAAPTALAAAPSDRAPAALVAVSPDPPPRAGLTPSEPGRAERVAATADGAVTTDGAVVIAGSPSKVPPTRPATDDATDPGPTWVNAMADAPRRPALRAAEPALPESMQVAAASVAPPLGAPLGQPGAVPGGVGAEALGAVSGPPAALAFVAEGEEAATDAAPGAVALASFAGSRPLARPDALAPPAPEALAGFDGPRPPGRPEGLAPEEPAVAEAEPAAPDPAVEAALAAAQATGQAPPPAEPAPEQPVPDVQSALASIVAGGADPLAGATPQAVAAARIPGTRPRNFDRVVQDQLARAARAAQPQAGARAVAQAAPRAGTPEEVESQGEEVSGAAAVPSGATAASVAQAATFSDVMAMREINLIGVFGQPNDRRALVRMGNGRYVRVGVGDSLDGGQVTAIGDYALNYTKRGRQLQLVIPGG